MSNTVSNCQRQNYKNFSLVWQPVLKKAEAKNVSLPVNHIVVIDCSGSMASELPRIRQQLKTKLPTLVKEGDTITIIWFSGRGEYGVLKEEVDIASLKDLSDLNNAVDQFLKPIGLTGFKEPLETAKEVIGRITATRRNSVHSLFFVTDGYDNQWEDKEIIKAVQELQPLVTSAVFVEYGYYCNRALMSKMAEEIGGQLIFSESFATYESLFEASITKGIFSAKKVEVELLASPLPATPFAFTVDRDGSVTTYKTDGRTVFVPEATEGVYFLSESEGEEGGGIPFEAQYAALQLLSVRMQSDMVHTILRSLGDVRLAKYYTNAFGKHNLTTFQQMVSEAITDPAKRFVDGVDTDVMPSEDAYCVLDLLTDLSNDKECRFHPRHPDFKYSKIGANRTQTTNLLTEEEQGRIKELSEQLATTRETAKIALLTEEINTIRASKYELKFEYDDCAEGYPVSDIVWNEERANASIRVVYKGRVKVPANEFGLDVVECIRYKNYTVIRDGIVNFKFFPASLSEGMHAKAVEEGVLGSDSLFIPGAVYSLNLAGLPVINRSIVKSVSARETFLEFYDLMEAKAAQKVWNFLYAQYKGGKKEAVPNRTPEESEWLYEMGGINNRGEFNPRVSEVKTGETYTATELRLSAEKMGTLPSAQDVWNKLEGWKVSLKSGIKVSKQMKSLTPREAVLAPYLLEYWDFTASDVYASLATQEQKDALALTWVEGKRETAITIVRRLQGAMARKKFAIILGQVWFNEFSSMEENTMELPVQMFAQEYSEDKCTKIPTKVKFKVDMVDVQIEI